MLWNRFLFIHIIKLSFFLRKQTITFIKTERVTIKQHTAPTLRYNDFMDARALAAAEVTFLTDDRVCMLVRVLFDNNGDKVSFLTADKVCTLGRVLGDNAGVVERMDEAVGIVE